MSKMANAFPLDQSSFKWHHFNKMKKLILITLLISFNTHAENSRSPAVLDGSCNLDIPTTITTVIDGKHVVTEKPIAQVQKEQCSEVRKCMNSALDGEMEELKSLEAVACNNTLNAVTTKTPGNIIDKNYDGKRKAKAESEPEDVIKAKPDTKATVR